VDGILVLMYFVDKMDCVQKWKQVVKWEGVPHMPKLGSLEDLEK